MMRYRLTTCLLLTAGVSSAAPTELVLSAEAAKQAGIQTASIQSAPSASEFLVYGKVVDLSGLLEVRQQWQLGQAQQQAAQAKRLASQQNLQRTEQLFSQDIVSHRQLQEQKAQSQQDAALVTGSASQQQATLAAARVKWGSKLTEWITRASNTELNPWLQGDMQLVEVSVTQATKTNSSPKQVWLAPLHQPRTQAISAQLLDTAPQIDPVTQAQRYFYKISQQHWPVGTQLNAWLSDGASETTDIWLDESSVVWQNGQAWVFVVDEPLHYQAIALPNPKRQGNGYRSGAPLQIGMSVVVKGAQSLLSQQLKGNSKESEADDD